MPIVPASVDRAQRRGAIGLSLMPTGDYPRDLAILASFFRAQQPGNPRLAHIDRDAADRSTPAPNPLGDPT